MLMLPFNEHAEVIEIAVQELPAFRQQPSASQAFIHLMPEVCVILLLDSWLLNSSFSITQFSKTPGDGVTFLLLSYAIVLVPFCLNNRLIAMPSIASKASSPCSSAVAQSLEVSFVISPWTVCCSVLFTLALIDPCSQQL